MNLVILIVVVMFLVIYVHGEIRSRKILREFELQIKKFQTEMQKELEEIDVSEELEDEYYNPILPNKHCCYTCVYLEYQDGDINDPEGFVCTKVDLFEQEEIDMLRRMDRKEYRLENHKCWGKQ